ncbi:MAG: Tad domain-containing protein, partial [bacterium]
MIYDNFQNQRGSFLVAGALFIVVFMMVAGLGIDSSRYYLSESNVQSIADGAALSGAKALQQYTDSPDQSEAYDAVIRYINNRQGEEYADIYREEPSKYIKVRKITQTSSPSGTSSNCQPASFSIQNGSIQSSQRTNAKTEVLGSAVTDQNGNRNYPVTAQVTISDTHGNDTTYEPWGDYNNPNNANLNNPSNKNQLDLSDKPPYTKISAKASLYMPGWTGGYMKYREKNSASNDVKVLRDGDDVPGVQGGFNQKSVANYISNYVDGSDGTVDLKE